MKVGDRVRVRLECMGIDSYLNQAGVIENTHLYGKTSQYIVVKFDNPNVKGDDHPFYEFELEKE